MHERGVDYKMHLLTSMAFMFSPISISGGGVHQPEPKCHLDPKSSFFISGGGYIGFQSVVFMFKVHLPHAQAILQCHLPSEVTLTNFNFPNPGRGVHLQVDR